MTSVPSDPIIWVDIETTGLTLEDLILEVGVTVTNGQLVPFGSCRFLIDNGVQVDFIRQAADPFVQEMHDKSGLWDDLLKYKSIPLAEAQSRLVGWLIQDIGLEPRTAPMAGSSIHFDRQRLGLYLPSFEAFAHYRNIDVSTIKELARRWAPSIYENRPGKDDADKKHRVLDDLVGSVDELKYYQAHFLDVELVRPR